MIDLELQLLSAEGEPLARSLRPAPASNTGFCELEPAFIKRPEARGLRLRVDDQPLPLTPTGASQAWAWRPGFYAGEVTAELQDETGSVLANYLLDVAPDSSKLGRELFDKMIGELRASDPELLYGTEPSTSAVGSLGESENLLIAYTRLRQYGAAFEREVSRIAQDPIRVARVKREELPPRRIRRADRQTAVAASRNTAAARLLAGQNTAEALNIDPALCFDVPVIERSVDCAANRLIMALLLSILRRTRSIRDRLLSAIDREQDSETRTSLAPRYHQRLSFLADLESRLLSRLRREPFPSIGRGEVSVAGLTAVAAHPLYARAQRLAWYCLRTGLHGPNEEERLWMSPTWEVYERWCFLRVVEAMKLECSDHTWSPIRDHASKALACWRGLNDNGSTIEVLLQPMFRSGNQPGPTGFCSVSGKRLPDIAITFEDDRGASFLVLDAKYRVTRSNVLNAMASAHIYQDSLRWRGLRPSHSLLLIPAGGGAPWLEEPVFHAREKVGVVVLGPGSRS